MPVQTSQVTSGGGQDLSIDPAAGQNLKITSSLDTANPGETPLSTTTADGTVKRLDMNNLDLHPPAIEDADWVLIQDTSDAKKIKKLKATDLGGVKQPPFGDLPADGVWVDMDTTLAVKEGGSGTTAALRNSVEFAVVNNTYNQVDKNVVSGNRVQVRWVEAKMISANHGDTISGTLYGKVGSRYEQTWNLAITKQPTAGWDIAPLIGQPVSTQVESSFAFPSGFNAPSPVTINGGTLTTIEVSVNGGAWTATPGNIISGQTIQVRGTTGTVDNTTYTALISIGGIQRTWNVTTVAAPGPAVAQPQIIAPANNATDLGSDITVTSSVYAPLNGAGAHASSDWELKKAGVVVSSSMADTANLESWTIPPADLEENTTYTVRVLHRSNDPVDSPWSVESTFTTGSFGYNVGDAAGGGYFYGQIFDGGTCYNLFVAPVTSGGLQGQYGGASPTLMVWHPSSSGPTLWSGATNLTYGGEYCGNASFTYVQQWQMFLDYETWGPNAGRMDLVNGGGPSGPGTGIGGYNDWYIPARHELEILYRNLKPSTDPNSTVDVAGDGTPSGVNPDTCPNPTGKYTDTDPQQTTVAIFQTGGAEALSREQGYWTVNEHPHASNPGVWVQEYIPMSNGQYTSNIKTGGSYLRVIRREPS